MLVAVDTETHSLIDKTPLGVSIAYKLPNSKIFYKYYPIKHNETKTYSIFQIQKLFTSLFKYNPIFIFHNSSFDIPVLYNMGINVLPYTIHDTMIISHLLDERQSHGLKELVKKYIGYQMQELNSLLGKGKGKKEFWETGQQGIKYASEDALYTYLLFEKLYIKLQNNSKLFNLYQNIERPLLYVTAKIHIHGIYLDTNKIDDIKKYCESKINLLEKKLNYFLYGININSPQQLVRYFINQRKLPIIKRTPKGNPAINKEVLKEYAKKDIVAKLLLEYRKFNKIYTTFIPAFLNNKNGWIYPSFNQVATKSGRFSSSNPNFQNIPVDDKFGLRECVIAPPGYNLIGADYSQIELRIASHVSEDKKLIEAYINGEDIHDKTAKALGIERRAAKTINFGILYGIEVKSLAKQLGVSRDESMKYKEKFFRTYPQLKQWIDETKNQILDKGYTETIYHRKRRVSYKFYEMNEYEQSHEIRALINHVIQGSAADIMKIAMIKVDKTINPYKAKIVSTVHDELLINCPSKNTEKVLHLIKTTMEDFKLKVPLVVEIKSGRSWKDVH